MKSYLKRVTPMLVAAMAAVPAVAESDYGEIRRDVEVLSRALLAAGNEGDGRPSITRIEGNYLAGQGVVLHLSPHRLGGLMGARGFHLDGMDSFGEDIGVFVEEILEGVEASLEGLDVTIAGLPMNEFESSRVVVLDEEELEEIRADVRREISGTREQLREEIRDLRKEQANVRREYERAQRQYERSLDEYHEQLESGGDEAAAQAAYAEAEAAMAAAREEYRKGRSAYQDKVEAAREEQRAAGQRRIEEFANATLDNFCRYGTSLRSLPNDEHITLIFEGLGGSDADEDLIYVIEKKDHSACLTGDIEGSELASRAVSYRF